jgi:transcriptional regulator with XRE-family HTH domain
MIVLPDSKEVAAAGSVVVKTLLEMRIAANMTQSEVGAALGHELRQKPYTHARIHQIESEGTKNADQIEALARIYNRPVSFVYIAAKSLRK